MKRTKKPLSALTSKKLLGYAAAGTATVAAAPEADATINIVSGLPSTPNTTVPFDFDNDGTVEFILSRNSTRPSVNINDGSGTGLFVAGNASYVSNLAAGTTVTGFTNIVTLTRGDLAWGAGGFAGSEFVPTAGNDPNQGYVGVRFNDGNGNPSHGWIEVAVDTPGANNFTVLGAAWANDPGVPGGQTIAAGQIPEPGSLGLLAVGGAGLLAWRRRRKSPMS